MAIIYICKQCKGAGRVERKLWILSAKMACPSCNGEGKRKYIKEKTAN